MGDEAVNLRERVAAAELEIARLTQRIEALSSERDDLKAQLSIIQHAFQGLELRIRRFEVAVLQSRRGASAAAATPPPTPAPTAVPSPAAPRPESNPAALAPADPLLLIHLEKNTALSDAVRAAAAGSSAEYCPAEAAPRNPARRKLLVLNLHQDSGDPLADLTQVERWGLSQRLALTYCAEGSRGVVLGLVRFFPPPFDATACATDLLSQPRSPQRLLVVSENFEVMNELKAVLSRQGCGISMAFDARQALDLVPMIRPDLMLIDLLLPKGEGFRLIGRIKSTPDTSRSPLALFWTKPLPPDEVRQHTVRAIRDSPFGLEELSRAVRQTLMPGAFEI